LSGAPDGIEGVFAFSLSFLLLDVGNFPTFSFVVRQTWTTWLLLSTQVLLAATVVFGSTHNAKAEGTCEIGKLVFSDTVWETNIVDFYETYRDYRFRWTNKAHTVAYFHGKRIPLTSYGKRLAAARVLFRNKYIARVELLAYDEAVDGKIPKTEFEQLFTQIRNTIGIYSGRGNPGISVNDTDTGTRRELWVNDATAFFLEYRYQSVAPQFAGQFRGDFIRLTTAPRAEATSLRTKAKPKIARQRTLLENVRFRGNTVSIEHVPLSLEGNASSSDAASAEMLFSYLRMPIDQREIAATMSAELFSNSPFHSIRTSLYRLAPVNLFNRKVLCEWNSENWQRLVSDYNWYARLDGKPLIDTKQASRPSASLRKMDLAALKKARERDRSIHEFWENVRIHVDRGIPILWGVQLGMVPEGHIPLSYYDSSIQKLPASARGRGLLTANNERMTAPQPTATASKAWPGKHMRLIIGYDIKRRDIIYTDPWGEEHAHKRMSLDDANAITLTLLVVQPKF
jgi:hypothetical protein